MKTKRKKQDPLVEYIKANRKGSREAELENHGRPVSHNRIHVSKKVYNRKRMKKVSEKDTFFFVMLPVHYPFLFLNHLWSSQLSLFEKPSYRNK